MRWDVAHMPVGPYGHQHTRVTWDGISINSAASQEHKEIAWRFIKHLLSDHAQEQIGSTQRGMPIRRAHVLSHYIDPDTPAHEEIALEATYYAKLTPITPRYLELRDAMQTEFDELNTYDVTGTTPAEAFARIEPKINAVIDKEIADWASKLAIDRGADARGTGLKALGTAVLMLADRKSVV